MNTFTSPPIYPESNNEKNSKNWVKYVLGILTILVITLIIFYWFKYVKVFQQRMDVQESIYRLPITDQFIDWKTFENKDFAYSLKHPSDWSQDGMNIIVSQDRKAQFNIASKTCGYYQPSDEFKESIQSATTSMFYKDVCRAGLPMRLTVYGTKETLAKYQTVLEQILSTVQLNVDDSLWQTYENKNFLFKFKHPKELKLKINENYSQVSIYIGGTNFYISASKPGRTLNSIKQTKENWQPIKFKGRDALLSVLGDTNCDKEIIFVDKGIEYEIMDPDSCSAPLDRRIYKIYETFNAIDLENEAQTGVLNGVNYRDEKYGFEFKYPTEWSLKKGPITYSVAPNTIVVRYTTKNNVSKPKCKADDGLFLCTSTKISNAGNVNAYIYLDKGTEFVNKRILEKDREYFQDYVDIMDKNGNKITIEFFSVTEKEESLRLITAILSTFKFVE